MKKEVLIIQRRIPKYRVALFERLQSKLSDGNIKLHLITGVPSRLELKKKDEGSLRWAVKVPCYYIKVKTVGLVIQIISSSRIRTQDLVILPHENSYLYNYMILLLKSVSRFRIAFWGHGGNFQSIGRSLREQFKSWTAKRADWWFAYTPLSVEKIRAIGFPDERITCLNNTIDVNALVEMQKSISQHEIYEICKKLGLSGKHVAIFIGSLYEEKRLPFLMAAADRLRIRIQDFELIMMGDGPLRRYVKDEVKARPWIKWVGAVHGRQKVLYASVGKVMLNPGLVGLNILDSFALRLPLVTTECGIHSPEIAYLVSGRNGLMTGNTIESFVDGVQSLMMDKEQLDAVSDACGKDAELYGLEKMVQNFYDGICQAIETEPLRPKFRTAANDVPEVRLRHKD